MAADYEPFKIELSYSPDASELTIRATSWLGTSEVTAPIPFTHNELEKQLAKFADSALGRRARYMSPDFQQIPVMYLKYRKRIVKPLTPQIFIDRDNDLDVLVEKILNPSTRLVSIHGFGGIGKSSVSKAMIDEIGPLFDEALYLNCAGLKSLLDSLFAKDSQIAHYSSQLTRSSRDHVQELTNLLDQKLTLLVLDNVDSIIDSNDTKAFLEILSATRNLKVLLTIRVPQDVLKSGRDHALRELNARAHVYVRALWKQLRA